MMQFIIGLEKSNWVKKLMCQLYMSCTRIEI